MALALVYLETQNELWSTLAGQDWLPPAEPQWAGLLADEYTQRFTTGTGNLFEPNPHVAAAWTNVASAYARYSSDKSNERSLDDQLRNGLRRAAAEGRFVPWCYCFFDSATSGQLATRRGYRLVKGLLESAKNSGAPDTLYLDDFTRASRDAVESYRLARVLRTLRKRLIGASDGFDLDSPQANMQLAVTAMFSDLFINQTQQKVRRGLIGASKRGTSTGRAPFGYRLEPLLGPDGKVVTGGRGSVLHRWVVDQSAAEYVRMAYKMYGVEHASPQKIQRRFNAQRVGGRNDWSQTGVRSILSNPICIGVRIYNRGRSVMDPETGRVARTPNPRSEWEITVDPSLRIIDDELWKKVRRRAAATKEASPLTGRRPRRAAMQLYPTSLLSGTLICKRCKEPLTFGRGGEGGRHYWCSAAHHGSRGCDLRYKKADYVENAIMRYLSAHILNDHTIKEVVRRANSYMDAENSKPQADVTRLRERLGELKSTVVSLSKAIEGQPAEYVKSVVTRIVEGEREIHALQAEIAAVDNHPPLSAKVELRDVEEALRDLQSLLKEDVAIAAPAIRALTGPISVSLRPVPGRPNPVWVAEFECNLIAGLEAAARHQTPNHYQMVGRGFRLHPPKTNCLVLDFGGNILRHGPVDALDIKDRTAGSGEAPAKECPQCQAVIHAAYSICPDCGHEFPPPNRGKHEQEASTAGILSGEITETEHQVIATTYSIHTKRDAPEGHPRTMRVDYQVGWNEYRSEWVCLEHTGFARGKAEAWWKLRSHLPVPDDVDDAVALASAGALASALSITVRSVSGEKYDRIVGYQLGPKPDLGEGMADASYQGPEPDHVPADDDIPF